MFSIAVIAGLAATAVECRREPQPDPPRPIRSAWLPPPTVVVGAGSDYPFGLAISPDGRQLVYPAARTGAIGLWLEDLSTGRSKPLPFTDGAVAPFWSSDGKRIGFFANEKVRAIEPASGDITDLGAAPSPRGGSWNAAGDLVYAPDTNGGLRWRGADGTERALTAIDAAAGEISHQWPAFLADGRHLIFVVRARERVRSGVFFLAIDNPRERVRVASSDTQAIVSGNSVIYANSDALMSLRLDPETLQPASDRDRLIGLAVGTGPVDQLFATASDDVLIYGAPGTSLRDLQWFDRAGARGARAGEPVEAWDFRISPDGKRVAVTKLDPQIRSLDIWLQDGLRPLPTRLSLSIEADSGGAWSPDGSRVAWVAARRRVTIRGAGAVLPEQVVATFDQPVEMWDWARDGRTLVIGRADRDTQDDLWLQPTSGEAATVYAKIPFNQVQAVVSPDGKWIAYASDESGKHDIYVDSFPTAGHRSRLTTAGGQEPRWRQDSGEVYFRRGSEIHVAVLALSEGTLIAESSSRLFETGANVRAYDVSADGARFLLNVPASSNPPGPATLIVNWNR